MSEQWGERFFPATIPTPSAETIQTSSGLAAVDPRPSNVDRVIAIGQTAWQGMIAGRTEELAAGSYFDQSQDGTIQEGLKPEILIPPSQETSMVLALTTAYLSLICTTGVISAPRPEISTLARLLLDYGLISFY